MSCPRSETSKYTLEDKLFHNATCANNLALQSDSAEHHLNVSHVNRAWKAASLMVDTKTDFRASLNAVAVFSRASSDNGCKAITQQGVGDNV